MPKPAITAMPALLRGNSAARRMTAAAAAPETMAI
jgi:hypothetical protein